MYSTDIVAPTLMVRSNVTACVCGGVIACARQGVRSTRLYRVLHILYCKNTDQYYNQKMSTANRRVAHTYRYTPFVDAVPVVKSRVPKMAPSRKRVIVFDINGTLLHRKHISLLRGASLQTESKDLVTPTAVGDKYIVYLRPHVVDTLTKLNAAGYIVGIYTSMTKFNADMILDMAFGKDRDRLISFMITGTHSRNTSTSTVEKKTVGVVRAKLAELYDSIDVEWLITIVDNDLEKVKDNPEDTYIVVSTYNPERDETGTDTEFMKLYTRMAPGDSAPSSRISNV